MEISSLQRAKELIIQSHHIMFVSHIDADADTLGSSLALNMALTQPGQMATLYNKGTLPRSLDFLPGFAEVTNHFDETVDLVVAVDCGDRKRLYLDEGSYKIVNIDHHISNPGYGDVNIIDIHAVSTGSVVLDFLRFCGIVPSSSVATCLFAAIAGDSGFFRYAGTNEKTFLDAAYLVSCGANPEYIAEQMTQRESISKMRLLSHIFSTLRLEHQGRIGIAYMSLDMVRACDATQADADGIVERIRSICGVEVSIFIRETSGFLRVSLRSKKSVDVNAVSALFGGGGHRKAAGFTVPIQSDFEREAESVCKKILSVLSKDFLRE